MDTMTRGQLAKRTGVSMATLRYYEDSGILPAPHRSANGYRVYTDDYLVKVKFIKGAQTLGYSLKEIQETLELLSNEDMEKETLKALVRERIADIEKHIGHLKEMQQHLATLLHTPEEEIDSYIQSFRVNRKEP
ncbi:DNA-binding transcriptional MerR regulator [Paenibacillus sp. JGP012]|uniref:Transcriptional regulator n=1 Tax=Paenibacillus silvae TaxID=1325358 RepID=A0A2W6NAY2_9BACL|nr:MULTISPECIES: MerR family transcriptional regulator [Paenibacillus]MBB6020994.1 DNA-binding transcriptional MerR regulator [Paenibacillus sp. JGP012]MCK6078905.1 MerR family transcriptional regulator [Paenibacillus silvae]MCK6153224.1 MerR family transcriptional regulator [Paenibacillus silvae]MCK6271430.1 MerR family transcriptional regulator [Paenibacillus silvae]PZT53135.1 transcriptional regulator [Paenibacillus silvae]